MWKKSTYSFNPNVRAVFFPTTCLRFTHLLFVTLSLCPLSLRAMDGQTLLGECLSVAAAQPHQSKVEVRITHKSAPEELHHFARQENGQYLFLRPLDNSGVGLLVDHQQKRRWLYDVGKNSLQPLPSDSPYPEWLLSESLLDKNSLSTFALTISNQSSMGGQHYYTVIATTEGPDPFPKRSLSFKIDGEQKCDLIRAAYFDAHQKLRKKIYVQWQPLADTKILKALHIEDVQSLEAVRYHIEEAQVVDRFGEGEFPAVP